VVDGLANSGAGESTAKELESTIKRLKSRWFVIRHAHAKEEEAHLLQPRWAMSYLRGPMTRNEIRRALAGDVAEVHAAE
jgi:hypothetical protein